MGFSQLLSFLPGSRSATRPTAASPGTSVPPSTTTQPSGSFYPEVLLCVDHDVDYQFNPGKKELWVRDVCNSKYGRKKWEVDLRPGDAKHSPSKITLSYLAPDFEKTGDPIEDVILPFSGVIAGEPDGKYTAPDMFAAGTQSDERIHNWEHLAKAFANRSKVSLADLQLELIATGGRYDDLRSSFDNEELQENTVVWYKFTPVKPGSSTDPIALDKNDKNDKNESFDGDTLYENEDI